MGYTTKSLTEGNWYLIGSAFENTDSQPIDIQKFITGLIPVEGYSESDCPTIQYWDADAGSLVTLVYSSEAMDPETLDTMSAWADLEGMAVTLPVQPGFTCWIRVPAGYGDAQITFAGQVCNLDKVDMCVNKNWQLLGNPYPTTTKFNLGKLDCSGLVAAEGYSESDCATIQYWDEGEGMLVTLVYSSEAMDPETLDSIVAWADLEGMAVDTELSPCTGFWIIAPTDDTCGTISWKK